MIVSYNGFGSVCSSPPTCPSGYTATVVGQDIQSDSSTCPEYNCLDANRQSIGEYLTKTKGPCNQTALFFQPMDLVIEAAILGILFGGEGLEKLFAIVPAGFLLVSNLTSRMDYDATGNCVVMNGGL